MATEGTALLLVVDMLLRRVHAVRLVGVGMPDSTARRRQRATVAIARRGVLQVLVLQTEVCVERREGVGVVVMRMGMREGMSMRVDVQVLVLAVGLWWVGRVWRQQLDVWQRRRETVDWMRLRRLWMMVMVQSMMQMVVGIGSWNPRHAARWRGGTHRTLYS